MCSVEAARAVPVTEFVRGLGADSVVPALQRPVVAARLEQRETLSVTVVRDLRFVKVFESEPVSVPPALTRNGVAAHQSDVCDALPALDLSFVARRLSGSNRGWRRDACLRFASQC